MNAIFIYYLCFWKLNRSPEEKNILPLRNLRNPQPWVKSEVWIIQIWTSIVSKTMLVQTLLITFQFHNINFTFHTEFESDSPLGFVVQLLYFNITCDFLRINGLIECWSFYGNVVQQYKNFICKWQLKG